jgi:hypothetical protein
MAARMTIAADRSALAWRIGGMIACAALAWGALVNAFADAGRARAPEAVLRFIPSDAGARASYAERLMGKLGEPTTQEAIADLIHGSLTYDALNPKALRLQGFVADAKGDHARARRLVLLAERASRRDPGAQLWLIEDRVAQNDIVGALRHYDTALNTVSQTDSVLFPVLAKALSDTAVRQAFVPIFRANHEWLPSFMSYWIESRNDPLSAAELVIAAKGFPRGERYRDLDTSLMLALADSGEFDTLRRLYVVLPSARRDGAARTDFAGPLINPRFVPIAWRLLNGPDTQASFHAGSSNATILDALSAAGTRAVVARKLVYLQPGSHEVRLPVHFANSSRGGAVTLAAQCLAGKAAKPIGSSQISGSGLLTLRIAADAACAAYYLDIGVAGGDAENGLEAEIGAPSLVRVAGR